MMFNMFKQMVDNSIAQLQNVTVHHLWSLITEDDECIRQNSVGLYQVK